MNTAVTGLHLSMLRWTSVSDVPYDGFWERVPDGLRVIETPEQHNGERWLHVSASYSDRLPSWEDMREVKDAFCGKGREAYMVFSPEERYVNDHPYVLHLWCPLEGAVLPDFRRFGPRLGKSKGMTL